MRIKPSQTSSKRASNIHCRRTKCTESRQIRASNDKSKSTSYSFSISHPRLEIQFTNSVIMRVDDIYKSYEQDIDNFNIRCTANSCRRQRRSHLSMDGLQNGSNAISAGFIVVLSIQRRRRWFFLVLVFNISGGAQEAGLVG